jgi:hypothetical protein
MKNDESASNGAVSSCRTSLNSAGAGGSRTKNDVESGEVVDSTKREKR